jgi:hypothetical protein
VTARDRRAFDERRVDEWMACFASDACIEFVNEGRFRPVASGR